MKRKEEEKYLGSFKNKFKKNRQNMFNGKKKKKNRTTSSQNTMKWWMNSCAVMGDGFALEKLFKVNWEMIQGERKEI